MQRLGFKRLFSPSFLTWDEAMCYITSPLAPVRKNSGNEKETRDLGGGEKEHRYFFLRNMVPFAIFRLLLLELEVRGWCGEGKT